MVTIPEIKKATFEYKEHIITVVVPKELLKVTTHDEGDSLRITMPASVVELKMKRRGLAQMLKRYWPMLKSEFRGIEIAFIGNWADKNSR